MKAQQGKQPRRWIASFWVIVALGFGLLQALIDADVGLWFLDKFYTSSPTVAKPFKDHVVWITGASSGIGAALAHDMVEGGAKVIISARRQDQLMEVQKSAANKYPESGGYHAIDILPLDVTDLPAQAVALEKVMGKYGHLDTLVLNAGRSQRALAVDFPLTDTKSLFDLNVFSYMELTRLVLPHMQKRHAGKIVVMSSLAGKMGVPISSSYSASKFALHGYFDAIRAEVSRDGVKVLMVCPGPVKSEIVAKAMYSKTAAGSVGSDDNEKKMPTERCSRLVASAMYFGLSEVWISHQPFLLFTYLSEYCPFLARQLWTGVVGPARVKTMLEGGDVFDVRKLFGLGSASPKPVKEGAKGTKAHSDIVELVDKDKSGEVSKAEIEATFGGMDVDKSGRVTKSEWSSAMRNPEIVAVFLLVDTNGDGSIALEEFITYVEH